MADYNILGEMFLALTHIKRVIVYAEALALERYELLAVIDQYITGADRQSFLQQVENWNKTNN